MKIVLNKDFGGFSVSEKVCKELKIGWDNYGYLDNKDLKIESDNYLAYRSDIKLINAIEKIGLKESSGEGAHLKIVEVPDDIEWKLDYYGGIETIHEIHANW